MQSKENRALSEKLASMDLQRSVTSFINNSATCGNIFTTAGNMVTNVSIPVTIGASNPVAISLNSIPGIITTKGYQGATGLVSPLSNTLYILPATPQGNSPPGIQFIVTGSSPYTGTLYVNFDQSQLVRGIHNLQFSNVSLQVSTTGAITGCSATGGGGAFSCNSSPLPTGKQFTNKSYRGTTWSFNADGTCSGMTPTVVPATVTGQGYTVTPSFVTPSSFTGSAICAADGWHCALTSATNYPRQHPSSVIFTAQ